MPGEKGSFSLLMRINYRDASIMPSLAAANFAALPWETVVMLAMGGLTGGLAFAVVLLLGRRSSPAAQSSPPPHHAPQPSATDRRAAPRRAGRHVDLQILDADRDLQPYEGWVIDRSAGGLAIGSIHPSGVGTILGVRPLEGSQHVPWSQVEVRHCVELDHKSWRLGCKFVRLPPYSVMMRFG